MTGLPDGTGDRERVADLGHTRLDLDRSSRTGVPEAVYAAGKTPAQCVEIVTALLGDGDEPIVVTRCDQDHIEALSPLGPAAATGSTMTWRHRPTLGAVSVAVVSGGTSDQPVVDECVATLGAHGVGTTRVPDVGVAGLHRLTSSLEELRSHDLVVAVAGMEAALPTVLAGLISAPIVAVPTSVGYGSTFDGLTALLSMLSSCAPGIAVVGIDNGFGAACVALRMLALRVDREQP